MKKRFHIEEISSDCDEFYLYTVRDRKTNSHILKPTSNFNEAKILNEYMNAKGKEKRRPNKPKQNQYQGIIPN